MKDTPVPTKMVSILGEEEHKLGSHYHGRNEQVVGREGMGKTFAVTTHYHQLLSKTRLERITELEDKLEKAMNYDFDLVETIQDKIDLYEGLTDAEYKSFIRTKLLYIRNAIKPIIPNK